MFTDLRNKVSNAFLSVGLFTLLMSFSLNIFAVQLVTYDVSSVASSTTWPSSPWAYSSINSAFSGTGLIRGSSVTVTGTTPAGCYGGAGGWSSTGGTESSGFYFTLTVLSGNKVSLNSISTSSRRSSTGPTTFSVYYSINGGSYVSIGTYSTTVTSGTTGNSNSSTLSGIAALQNLPCGTDIKILVQPNGGTSNWYLTNGASSIILDGTVSTFSSPTIGTNPSTVSISSGASTSFTVSSVTNASSYQWQRNTSGLTGGTWVNITSAGLDGGSIYSGYTTTSTATSNTLTLTGATTGLNGYGYRCVVNNCTGSTNSNAALLNISSGACSGTPASGTAIPTTGSFCNSGSTTISLTGGSTGTGLTYQWSSSTVNVPPGTNISGATSTSYITPTLSTTTYYWCTSTCATSTQSSISSVGTVTINPSPSTITGASSICVGTNTTLSGGISGGVWSSSNLAVATIGSLTGLVNGVSIGTALVSYITACGSISTTITVNSGPSITSVSPMIGIPSTSSIIIGANFNTTPANNIVYFGATRATVTAATSTSLTLIVPVGATYMPVSVDNIGCNRLAYSQYPFLPTYNNSAYMPGTFNFNTGVAFLTTGDVPVSVVIGDIDGDGKSDVAMANFYSGTVSVFFNTSSSGSITTGSFAAPVDFATGVNPYSLALGDLDGDGKLDLTVVNYGSNTVSVFRNTSTAGIINSSSLATQVTFATGSVPYNIAIGDIDVDGKPDLIVANSISATVSILRNTCIAGSINTSSFATQVEYTTGSLPSCVAIGDIDGDGKPDVVVANSNSNSVSVLRNTSTPGSINSSSLATQVTFAAGYLPNSVVIGDIDGDGKQDVVVANNNDTGEVSVLRNTSTAGSIISSSLATKVAFPTMGSFPYSVAIGDIDGDGKPEVVATNTSSSTVSVFRNTSTAGSFNSSSLATQVTFATGDGAQCVAIGDIDGDGKSDLVLPTGSNTLTILRNNPLSNIIGDSAVCQSHTITLACATTGGTWSSSNTSVATVGSLSGIVFGVLAGTAIISYNVTGGSTTTTITVNPPPRSSAITGPSSVCVGSSIGLSNAIPDGIWSSSSANVSVSGGTITGLNAGIATIRYTVTFVCGIGGSSRDIIVNPLPNAGSITGPSTTCVGSSIGLSNATTGGVWSSASTNVSVSGSIITGVTAGTAIISYAVTNGCGTAYATKTITVNPLPNAGTITGPSTVCIGNTIGLSDVTTGGVWSSASANVSVSGSTITGVTSGTATISYAVTNGCGSAVATTVITVNPLPNAGTITGTSSVCVGSSIGLSDAMTGGVWSSASANVSITGSTITGVTSGTATISYTVTNGCGNAVATTVITVNPLPNSGTITGPSSVCVGSSIGLSDAITGGVWSSASANVSVSGSTITGVTSGTATISYAVTNGCGSAVATKVISINPLPNSGTITGPSSVCTGANITLVDTNSGGVWLSGSANATVGSGTGIVTGISVGTALISYVVTNSCGTAVATKLITINAIPFVGAIGGSTSVCAGANITLTDATNGGVWTSANQLVATVGSTSGIVHGVASGSVVISYSVSNSCGTSSATQTMNVNALPSVGTITGTSTVCTGNTVTLSDTSAGGVWSSSAVIRATVGSTGIVTGLTAGTAIISYVVINGCGSAIATSVITVNNSPSAGTIIGSGTVGTFASIPLTNATTGGVWSSGTPAVATVGSTGIVTGVAPGTTIISYTVTNSCGTATATKTIVVTSSLTSIVGSSSVCPGGTTVLTNATPGGIWTSTNTSVATIGSLTGLVTGISAGTTIISYTVLGNSVTTVMSVSSSTPPITGVTTVCTGNTTALSNALGGGAWTSSNTAKATVDVLSGLVTGVSAGTAIISYSVSCGISTTVVTVNSSPAAITGTTSVCQGSTTSLTDATTGGTWSSSNPAIASVGTTGIVRGVSGGTAAISYTLGSGCSSTAVVTVNSLFSSTGITTVCVGLTTVLNNPAPGGLWSSTNTTVATINCNLGIVKGITPGTTIISYTLGSGCTSTIPITVISLQPITGTSGVCVAATTNLTNTIAGGAWISSDAAIATVDSASGVVTGIAPGNVQITYSFGTGCRVNKPITVLNLPSNTGASNVCLGATTTIGNLVSGGTWSSSNTSIATVISGSGLITGVSSGVATITYRFGSTCIATTSLTVNQLPAAVTVSGGGTFCNNATITASGGGGETIYFQGTTSNGTSIAAPATSQVVTISGTYYFRAQSAAGCWGPQGNVTVLIPVLTGPTTLCTGSTTTLANTGGTGGRWGSSNTTVGTVNATTGVVSGITAGTTTIYDTLPSGCVVSTPVTVGVAPSINGAGVVCNGQTITLTNSATGGTWSSSAPTIATVGSTGIVSGIAAGNRATITYALSATCRSTISVSVTASNPISVTGTGMVCVGQTITLTNLNAGGTWSSSDGGIATVAAGTGVVTGVSIGTALISYILPSGCITTAPVNTKILSPISGPATVCVGQTITLVDTTDGGSWSTSAPTIATVGSLSGIVTGIAGNLNATLTYTLGTGCKATKIVSVNPLTPIAGYSGSMCQVCQGLSLTLTDVTTGGAWSSADPTIGAFSTGGIFNGMSAGIVTVSYTLPTGCITTLDAIVNPVAPIVGPSTVCLGQTMLLTESAGAGTWSSSAVTIATIGTTGVVKGIAANNSATITYTFCTGCKTTKVVSVNPLSIIAGSTSVCQGSIATMTDATAGGTWSSSAPGVLNFASTNGNVTGISAGIATVSYVLPTGCTSVMTMTVNPFAPIAGPNGVCYQKTIGLTDLVPGGAWSSLAPTIASVVATSGLVTGLSASNNSTTITYTTSAGCKATKVVSVYALPTAPPAIGGPATVSISGAPITLTNATTGGTWTSSNIARATVVPTSGVVTGFGLGTVIITYTVSNAAGCTNQVTKVVTVGPLPPPHTVTTKTVSINVDASFALNETVKGGIWTCNDCEGIVTLNQETGTITGIGQGRATITYTINNESGTSLSITRVVVNPLTESVLTLTKGRSVYLIPNPNKGEFTIKGNLTSTNDDNVAFEVVDILGQTIYKGNTKASAGEINEQVVLNNTLANGMYLLNLHSANEHHVFHFVIER